MSERVKIDVLDLAPVGSWYRPYLIAGFEAQARWQALREWLAMMAPYDSTGYGLAIVHVQRKLAELEREGGGE